MTYKQLSRFQVRSQNELLSPGKCAACGCISGNFVDFGLDLDFYGVVYFCESNCFREASEQLGFVHESLLERSRAISRHLNETHQELLAENEELRDALGIVTRYNSAAIVDSGQLELSLFDDADDSGELSEDNDSGPTEDESGPDESTTEQGSSSVLDIDSLNEFLGDI